MLTNISDNMTKLWQETVARFAVASVNSPRLTVALALADCIHQALVKHSGQAPVFAGKQDGRPLVGHRHAHVLCEANGRYDSISHISVFAPAGFDESARRALDTLATAGVWGFGKGDLRLVLLGTGTPESFPDSRLFNSSCVWRSLTPFVSTRHPKLFRDGRPKLGADGWPIGSPRHDLRRLLTEAGFPMPAKVEELREVAVNSRRLRPLEFQVERRHGGGTRAHQPPTSFQVTFVEPVRGPLAFGYGAHFGLGLFVPVAPSANVD
jgi:CRISPR-associated protein Csb2